MNWSHCNKHASLTLYKDVEILASYIVGASEQAGSQLCTSFPILHAQDRCLARHGIRLAGFQVV